MRLYTVGQKTAPFNFCNIFVRTVYSKIIIDTYIYTPINLEQNDIKIVNLSWRQCFVKRSMCVRICYLRHISFIVVIIVSNI